MPRDAIRAARAAPQPAAAAAPSAKAARTDTGADRQMVFADIKTRLPALSLCGEARCVCRMDLLFAVGSLGGSCGRIVHVQLFHRADGGLGEADLDAVTAGLQTAGVVLDGDQAADDAADGGHLIPDLQAVAHCCVLLLLLFLGTVDHEVQQDHHQGKGKKQADHAFSASHFQILLSKLFIVIIPVYTSGCKAKSANRPKKADFLDPGVQRLDVLVVELGESARVQLVPD